MSIVKASSISSLDGDTKIGLRSKHAFAQKSSAVNIASIPLLEITQRSSYRLASISTGGAAISAAAIGMRYLSERKPSSMSFR